ncbi:MAG: hypothetical protein R3C09_05810 [Pirellulaceae bacterium]
MRTYAILATLAFAFHCVSVLCFSIAAPPITGPNADSGAIAWGIWCLIDFPLGYVAVSLVGPVVSTHIGAVLLLIILGGIQWAFWVCVLVFSAKKLSAGSE